MEKNIAVIWGDCSSPEIVKQTIRVLDKVDVYKRQALHSARAAPTRGGGNAKH